ncbi:unnamed protein product [Diamesa hyperborea]
MIVALRCSSMRTSIYSSLHLNEVLSATNSAKKNADKRKFSTVNHKKSTCPTGDLLFSSSKLKLNTNETIMSKRWISVQKITSNLQLHRNKTTDNIIDKNTLRIKQDTEDRPMVLLLAWLLAKQKHLDVYSQMYLDQGFDVLIAHISPWQFFWPTNGAQLVAADVIKFLANNDYYKQIFVHGFSVGGYLWGEVLGQMHKDMGTSQKILDRICGQVWDSAADITEIPAAISIVVATNLQIQKALENYVIYHLKTFHDAATQHYIRSSQMFHTNLCHAPALFFVSKTDPLGPVISNQRVADSWISSGVDLTFKCFDESQHLWHYFEHEQEYTEALFQHLQKTKMINYKKLVKLQI